MVGLGYDKKIKVIALFDIFAYFRIIVFPCYQLSH